MSKLLFLLMLLVCSAAFAQPEQSEGPVAEAFLAFSNGEGGPGEESAEFKTTDNPIYCVVNLTGTDPQTVRMKLVAVRVAGLREGSQIVSTSYTTKQGENIVQFSGGPAKVWFVGKYRAEIFINDKLEKTLEFDVKGTAAVVPSTSFTENQRQPPARRRPPRKN
ncbi:MAG: hypothetical protein KF762_18275 [Acidobacteria bacterium]|nr:hypothetical protein [Acidobacteriota bacterium]